MQNKILKTSLKYGIAGGLIVVAYVTLLVRTGLMYHEGLGTYFGYAGIIIMPVCIFLALRELHNKQYERRISFKNAMIAGLLVSVIAAALYTSIRWVERQLFVDVHQEYLIGETRERMVREGTEPELIEKRITEIRKHYDSWRPVRNTFIWYIALGSLYSAGSFLILKYYHKPK